MPDCVSQTQHVGEIKPKGKIIRYTGKLRGGVLLWWGLTADTGLRKYLGFGLGFGHGCQGKRLWGQNAWVKNSAFHV